jgi:hypothetical protein
MPLAGRVVAAVTGGMLHRSLDRLYDDSHVPISRRNRSAARFRR